MELDELSVEHWRKTRLGEEPIYCAVPEQAGDILCRGSDDGLDDTAKHARRLRYEEQGRRYLKGQPPRLISASLRGPFDRASGWKNPWLKQQPPTKRNLAFSGLPRTKPMPAVKRALRKSYIDMSTPPSGTVATADSLQCHLPSPCSVRDMPLPEPALLDIEKLARIHAWTRGLPSQIREKDDFWAPDQGIGVVELSDDSGSKKRHAGHEWLKSKVGKRRKTTDTSTTATNTPTQAHAPKHAARVGTTLNPKLRKETSNETSRPLKSSLEMTTPSSSVDRRTAAKLKRRSLQKAVEKCDPLTSEDELSQPNMTFSSDARRRPTSVFEVKNDGRSPPKLGSDRSSEPSPIRHAQVPLMPVVELHISDQSSELSSVKSSQLAMMPGMEPHVNDQSSELSSVRSSQFALVPEVGLCVNDQSSELSSLRSCQFDLMPEVELHINDQSSELSSVSSSRFALMPEVELHVNDQSSELSSVRSSEFALMPELQCSTTEQNNDDETESESETYSERGDEQYEEKEQTTTSFESHLDQSFQFRTRSSRLKARLSDPIKLDAISTVSFSQITQTGTPESEAREEMVTVGINQAELKPRNSGLEGDAQVNQTMLSPSKHMESPTHSPQIGVKNIPNPTSDTSANASMSREPETQDWVAQASVAQESGDREREEDSATASTQMNEGPTMVEDLMNIDESLEASGHGEQDRVRSQFAAQASPPVPPMQSRTPTARVGTQPLYNNSQQLAQDAMMVVNLIAGGLRSKSVTSDEASQSSSQGSQHQRLSLTAVAADKTVSTAEHSTHSPRNDDMGQRSEAGILGVRIPLSQMEWGAINLLNNSPVRSSPTRTNRSKAPLTNVQPLDENNEEPGSVLADVESNTPRGTAIVNILNREPTTPCSHHMSVLSSAGATPGSQSINPSQQSPWAGALAESITVAYSSHSCATASSSPMSGLQPPANITSQTSTPRRAGACEPTLEPEISIKAFANFNTPPPKRKSYQSRSLRLSGGSLRSSLKLSTGANPWESARSCSTRRVSFAPLPDEEAASPSLPQQVTARAASPPPQVATESVDEDVAPTFQKHFDAQRRRSDSASEGGEKPEPRFRLRKPLLPSSSQQHPISPQVVAMAEAFKEADQVLVGMSAAPVHDQEDEMAVDTTEVEAPGINNDEVSVAKFSIEASPSWPGDSQGPVVDDVADVMQNLDDFLNSHWDVEDTPSGGNATTNFSVVEASVWDVV